MNQTSPAATGTAGAATGAVATLIALTARHFDIDIPAAEQLSLAVGLVTAAHWLGQQLAARSAAKASAKPAMPAA